MNNHHEFLPVLALCGALAVTACSSVNKDWADASAANTVAAYQSFVDKHAGDPHAQDAKAYILALQDDAAWKTAQTNNSLDSLRQYLQSEPNGSHAQTAREQIAVLERETHGRLHNQTVQWRRCRRSRRGTRRGRKRIRHGKS